MKSSTIAILGLAALHAVPKIFDIECPLCRSWCSLSEVKREETGSCNLTMKKRRMLKRGYGKGIPVVRTYYEVTFLCKRCGETVVRQEYRDMEDMRNLLRKGIEL
ncbi:hypothetical protein [Ructibacterium gallinarum]|uniref:Uncharacterized protein n=1 Tax=Ructibacterium gallinarum TaxID=2779355 RepID=A0A9D5R880_9FIRM|nr:hypothetical protein [Ructibacterium gallinarum]MBE5040136.1 hypothetical protein [Ructibacterium gallinarum]